MQKRQDAVTCEIRILGVADWKEPLAETIKLEYPWSHLLHAFEAPLIDVARKSVEVNGESFERAALQTLFEMGYRLEELECEFAGHPEWGKGVWYKEHPAYVPLSPGHFFARAIPSWYHAMFKTENAGDQHFGLYSTQLGALLHKTLVYRKVVLSPPEQKAASETEAA